MSDYTTTPNFGLIKPVPGEDDDVWGDHLNSNSDTIDTTLKALSDSIGVTVDDVTGALGYTPYDAANPAGYQTAANVTAALAPYALSSAVPQARNAARLQAQWQNAATVSDDTVWWWDMPYGGTINTLKYFTGNGSFNVAIKINGTTVTGLSAVAVSSATPATATATAANTFAAGDNITAVITGSTGAPTDALLSLAVTWS